MIRPGDTIISQYATSPTLVSLITTFNEAVDPAVDILSFYNNIWNIQTAQGYGLDVWGRIVGVGRVLNLGSVQLFFGFNEGQGQPFGQASFYSGSTPTNSFSLSDAAYQPLIQAKAIANVCNCSAPVLNQLLYNLFGSRGPCYVRDNGGMSMSWVFKFYLTEVELAIITQSGAFPRPAGVTADIVQGP